MKHLITGSCGFIGSYLYKKLRDKGEEVCGLSGIDCETSDRKLIIGKDDLSLIAEYKPDVVFHLAAQSHVGESWKEFKSTYEINFLGTVEVLEAIATARIKPIFILASSAEVYGNVKKEEQPLSEKRKPAPLSHYGISKLAAEEAAFFYRRVYGIKSIVVRFFNQIGPGQSPKFAAPSFAKRIAEAEKGMIKPVLEVGNLDAIRDFTDVRDGIEALYLISKKGKPGEIYNIGSGKVYSIKEILEILLSLSEIDFDVQIKRSKLRKTDIPILWADISKINKIAGWTATIPIEKTLLDLLNYWRQRVG